MSRLSKKKFLSLTSKRQHKHAALLLEKIIEGNIDLFSFYKEYEQALSLPCVQNNNKQLLDRIYLHQTQAMIPYSKHYKVTKKDKISDVPFLDIDIYLENLRSMHNIGAILRTIEAFRLGKVYISKDLPPSALEKINKTAMGADEIIPIHFTDSIQSLKTPIIAVETTTTAIDCNTFSFPKSFTLLFGNEKYGLSDSALSFADHYINIPLYGNKNSLNVSAAFSILANCIRSS